MNKKRYSEEQIIKAIKSHEAGRTTTDICQELGIAHGTFRDWRRKYDGLEAHGVKRLRDLEAENLKLKNLLAESVRKCESLQEVLSKKW